MLIAGVVSTYYDIRYGVFFVRIICLFLTHGMNYSSEDCGAYEGVHTRLFRSSNTSQFAR